MKLGSMVLTTFWSATVFAAEVLEPQPLSDETYAESFVAFADLSDGTYLKIQLGISNVGPGDGKGACRILLVEPGQKAWTSDQMVESDKWSHQGAELRMGPCSAVASDRLQFKASVGGGSFSLELTASPTPQKIMATKVKGGFYEAEVLVPWAAAKVSYTLPGKAEKSLSGMGYSDHSRSTAMPGELADKWVRFRNLKAGQSQLVLVRIPKQGAPDGWVWTEGVGRRPVSRVSVQGDGSQWKVMLDGEGGPWRMTSRNLLYRNAPVEQQGGLVSAVVGGLVGNPVTYEMRGIMESKQTGSAVSGIFEVGLANE